MKIRIAGNDNAYRVVREAGTVCWTIVQVRAFSETVRRSTLMVAGGVRSQKQSVQTTRKTVIKYPALRIHCVDTTVACHKRQHRANKFVLTICILHWATVRYMFDSTI